MSIRASSAYPTARPGRRTGGGIRASTAAMLSGGARSTQSRALASAAPVAAAARAPASDSRPGARLHPERPEEAGHEDLEQQQDEQGQQHRTAAP